jgi:hypothetical protein
MPAPAPATDRSSPSPGADLVLVVALLGVLTGVAWGVIWVQNAATADEQVSAWLGLVPPATAAACGGALLAVRSTYATLPRLRRFLTRVAWFGIAAAVVLAVFVASITLV